MKRVEESKGEGRRVEESAGVLEKERAGERRGLPERGIGKGMGRGRVEDWKVEERRAYGRKVERESRGEGMEKRGEGKRGKGRKRDGGEKRIEKEGEVDVEEKR